MKTTLLIAFLALLNIANAQNTWIQKAPVGGHVRIAASSFSIGTKAYIGTGYNNQLDSTLNDFWEWNPVTNIWTQKANFAGQTRGWAVGGSAGGKGYWGLGTDTVALGDFWEYDTSSNSWTQKALFGGAPTGQRACITIGTKLYVVGKYYDFWEYNPANNSWIQKTDYPGMGYSGQVGFSIGNKGYIGTGIAPPSTYCSDFWEYDPTMDTWTQKADFGGTGRACAVGFAIGTRGYIGTGGLGSGTTLYKDFWEYNPATNTWKQRASFGGTARFVATGFSMNGKGYIGTGWDASGNRNDFWEYTPDTTSASGIEEYSIKHSLTASPNPFSNKTTLYSDISLTDATLIVYNAFGQQIQQHTHITGNAITFNRDDLPPGLYLLNLINSNKQLTTLKVTIADF